MEANQPQWPRAWLMTDERIGDRLFEAIRALPAEAGVVFRHYSLGEEDRLLLGRQIAEVARAAGLLLAVAGSPGLATRLGAKLVHNPDDGGPAQFSMAVHDEAQALEARRRGASLAFVGPVYPTRSHPGAPALGVDRAANLARLANCPSIAVGGLSEESWGRLQAATSSAFHGFAGIDCWLNQVGNPGRPA
jgi:thiamine-phosphate pyrophosphorylase